MYQRTTLLLPKFPKLLHANSLRKLKISFTKSTTNTSHHHPSSISFDDNNPNTKLVVETLNDKHKKKNPLLTKILRSLDDFVSNFLDSSPLTSYVDPNHVLSGNFAPVPELPPTACEVVEGSLPSALNGAYIRNGPNPQFIPRGPYHLFDGDGMLHSVTIRGGEAVFCSRYVKTYKLQTEGKEGYLFFPSPFSSFSGGGRLATAARVLLATARGIAGYFNPVANGFGTGNTSVAFFGGALYALCESDLPYEIKVTRDGDVVTLGRRDLGSGDPSLRMTAHPQTDSSTGEVFAFRCDMFAPFLAFFRIDSDGKEGPDFAISSMKRMPCVHDFALTKRFIVFQDVQLEMDPMEAVKGRRPIVCDSKKVPRIGVLPRGTAEDGGGIVWIEVAGVNMMHVTNAWEEDCGNRIVIITPNLISVESGFDDTKLLRSEFEIITVDIKEKKVVSRCVLSKNNMEFGVINHIYAGKKNRYMYAAVLTEAPKAAVVVKFDLSLATAEGGDCTVATRVYEPGCYGGEPYFVAKEAATEEDDGFLVTYMHNENSKESWFLVMDAKSPTLDIVARVRLPGRVPYGFHGLFIPEKDLKLG